MRDKSLTSSYDCAYQIQFHSTYAGMNNFPSHPFPFPPILFVQLNKLFFLWAELSVSNEKLKFELKSFYAAIIAISKQSRWSQFA